jgi:ribosomal protein S24E
MEIIKNVENKLFGRQELEVVMESTKATPTRAEIKTAIAKQFKVEEDLVIINNIKNHFGGGKIKITAKIYENIELLNKNARPHMIKRNTAKAVEEEQ